MKNALRDSWTQYAEQRGLVREVGDAPQGRESLPTSRNKYGAKRTVVDNITFDSKKESARYQELKLMQMAGQIADLELQPEFPLHVMELWRSGIEIQVTTVGVFTPDFRYLDTRSGEIVIEDVKSDFTKNTAYKLRKKLAEAIHGVTITEL